ncbi:DNRLRE domain-containing protein [Streptomyces sp. NPDC051636]|uniref:DNRLRE domain-containing protein n=1 Tax=Streptomyces sp. NPDC051636 TaxID=3365663 RepID=UPI0037B77190
MHWHTPTSGLRRRLLAAVGGGALLAGLFAPAAAFRPAGTAEAAPRTAAVAETVPTASPVAQTGPRNIIKRLQDTYITNRDTADHSQGHLLHVGTPDNGVTKYRGFMRFDVSKLRGAPISRATLRVYNSFVSDCAAKAWMGVYPVTQPWDQSTITWANQPTVGAGKGTWFGLGHPDCPDIPNKYNPSASNGIQRIDVTDWVRAWANDSSFPNYGIRFSAQEDVSTGYKDFCSMNPLSSDYACNAAYNTPTLEVEFNTGSTPILSGNAYSDPNVTYPQPHASLEFLDSTDPEVWPASGPYQRWIPDAYHSVLDPSLKGDSWGGGTSHKLRPGGTYGGTVLVTADRASQFIGVIPYPALAGYHWAINAGITGIHGVEMLPDGTVVAASADHVFGQDETGKNIAGGLAVYSKAQGTPGNWSATPVQTKPLAGAHEVLYDPGTSSLWAIATDVLVRYDYAGGRLGTAHTWRLPAQAEGSPAYGHELTPVYGNPDRLWIGSNGGIVQFSKSGAVDCYDDTPGTWPVPAKVAELPDGQNHWCTNYANRAEVTQRHMIKSVGNDPATGRVISTCSQAGCPEMQNAPGTNSWDTAYIRFTPTNGPSTLEYVNVTDDRRYKATWAAPAYQ